MNRFFTAHNLMFIRLAGAVLLTMASAIGQAMPSVEHASYLDRVEVATIAGEMSKRSRVLTRVEDAIAHRRRFTTAVAESLTMYARYLSSAGAVVFELEVPTLYAEWDKTMSAMDRAESAGLYQPPEDLLKKLIFWRAKRDDRRAVEAAPWLVGPARVALDANLAEVTIPAGVRYLDAAQCAALRAQRLAIRSAARAELMMGPAPAGTGHALTGLACLSAVDGSWSAGLAVIDRGYIEMDRRIPWRADDYLQLMRAKWKPAHDLLIASDLPEAKQAVRWVIPPTIEAASAIARWSLTDGAQTGPLGVDYEFLKFGATQQVLITANELHAAEVLTEIEKLPKGYVKERFTADDVIRRLRQTLAPLEQSLAFLPGHRYEDATADTPRNSVTMDLLIVGPASELESAQRIPSEPPRPGVLQSLWSHPRALALIGIALWLIVIGTKRAASRSR